MQFDKLAYPVAAGNTYGGVDKVAAATCSCEKRMEMAVKQHLAAAGGRGTDWDSMDNVTSIVGVSCFTPPTVDWGEPGSSCPPPWKSRVGLFPPAAQQVSGFFQSLNRAWRKRSKAEAEGTVGVTVALWWQTSSVFPSRMPMEKQMHQTLCM